MRAAWEPLRGADAAPAPPQRQAGGLDDAQAQALQRAAWLRAMEKSQAAGWLDHALLSGGGATASVPAAPQLFSAPHHDLRPPSAAPASDAEGGVRADAGAPGDTSAAATAGRWSAVDGAGDAARPPAATPRGAGKPGATGGSSTADTAGLAGAGRDAAATGADMGATRWTPASPAGLATAAAAMASKGPASPGALLAAMSAAVREAAPALGIDVAAASLSVGAAPPPGPGWAGALPGASWAGPEAEPEAAGAAEAPGAAPEAAEADAGEQAALRLHAEWLEHGVRVWIGADRRLELDAAGLTRLSEQLQQYCRQQGAPLLALVCNGKRVAFDGPGRDGAAPGNVDAGEHSDQPQRIGDGAATPLAPFDSPVSPLYTHQEQS
ncbi:hypothetical protein NHH82_21010 [Oxalobacteraceae bacterium OTU3REALA1]|nr:hypothetical protein NHH82_21010 [Oxalobacteraceae bacterium OTU3REALA1]